MNENIQPSVQRQRFYRRERRSVPLARGFVWQALADWGVRGRGEDLLLCVSELATNALLHGVPPGRGFRLVLRLSADGVLRLEVHDSGGGWPHARTDASDASAASEGGRGLFLVEMLSDKWGVSERTPGKVVWCEFMA
ncbi:ATP-binding protein [Streptomyces sp. NPDC050610]|uniref:ATP-binding protein n=1 Tax=Streptomyces sp. NPDC050610 TaxID=3157097 RepID=UPI003431CEC1